MIKGGHHSEETRTKMSESLKGNTRRKGKSKKIKTLCKKCGKEIYTWPYRFLISGNFCSNKCKSQYYSKEEVERLNKANKGKHISLTIRKNMSKAQGNKMPKNNQIPGKWNNVARGYFNINGKEMFFRSKWEANYALYLDFLIKRKQILRWEYEKDVFIFEKIKFGTRSYRPDFKVYNLDKTIEYHEVKGYMDSKSKTKIKRMAKYYPDIKLTIIDKDVYGDIKKKLGKILKFY